MGKLDDAARLRGGARQTVLNQVRDGRRNAVQVVEGKRRGLRIEIRPGEQGLLERACDGHVPEPQPRINED